jgi:hypothetical protein
MQMSILLELFKRDKYVPPAATVGTLEQKREAALEWLGDKWMLSPNYIYNPKHRIYNGNNIN